MLVLLYAAVLSFFVRLASGLLLTALLGAVLLLTGMFYKPLKKRKWPLCLLCAAYALLLAFVLFPALYSRNDTVTYDEDVLIVLGAGLDGEAVTPQLENRLEAAYAYHLRNPDAPVVVSGGQRDGEADFRGARDGTLADFQRRSGRPHPARRGFDVHVREPDQRQSAAGRTVRAPLPRRAGHERLPRLPRLRGWPKRRGWTLRTSTRTPSGTRCRCACCANARRSSNIGYREHKETARSGFRTALCSVGQQAMLPRRRSAVCFLFGLFCLFRLGKPPFAASIRQHDLDISHKH